MYYKKDISCLVDKRKKFEKCLNIRLHNKDKIFLSYKKCQKIALKMGVKSHRQWYAMFASKKLPPLLPSHPQKIYKNNGWTSWYDFLNTRRQYLSFEEAKKFAKKLNLKNWMAWEKYSKTNRPSNLPANPNIFYKNKGWKNYEDFLGYKKKHFIPFEKAKNISLKQKLINSKQWIIFVKNNPNANLPLYPQSAYKNKSWVSWSDFLGKTAIIYPAFAEVKKIANKLGFKNRERWRNYIINNLNIGLPKNPDYYYKNRGWISWGDFLGYKTIQSS
jgi:hypothetical protein